MKIYPLTRESVDYVIDNLDPVCREETRLFGKTLKELRSEFLFMIGKEWTASFYDGPICCAIMYHEAIGTMKWRIHFVYSRDGLKRVAFPITKFFARFADSLKSRGAYIEVLCPFKTPDSVKWFHALRLREDGEENGFFRYAKGVA